ncbi:hypothetical protein [Cupriavidus campinensis]
MPFKNIREVQHVVDQIGIEALDDMCARDQFLDADLAMISAWKVHAEATDPVAAANRDERAVLATESQAKSAERALIISFVSIAIAIVSLLVAIAALFKPGA